MSFSWPQNSVEIDHSIHRPCSPLPDMVKMTCERQSENSWFGWSGEMPRASQEPEKLEPPRSITKTLFSIVRADHLSLLQENGLVRNYVRCCQGTVSPPTPTSQCSRMRSFHLEPIIDGECWGCATKPPQSPCLPSSHAVPCQDGQEQEVRCPVPSSISGVVKAMHF